MITKKLRKIYKDFFVFAVAVSVLILAFSSCQPAAVDNGDDDDDTLALTEVKAMMVCNRDYYSAASGIFKDSKKTIKGIMYDMKYYSDDLENEVMKLIDELVVAAARGVDVKIVLEQSDWNDDVSADNYETGAYLESYGIDLRYDPLTITTHCKTFIIDTNQVLVGSTNWSYSAVSSNNEANVLLEGRKIALDFTEYFETLWKNSYKK
ncbi:TPA: hypothetical protein DCW38_03790 [candidate division WOR-3 bacterium]|uniref:phospholipase D n=1 Tax=candidate division WOR-3 bacterium TaxID=2052148 RepID=A0A350H9R8_UNCW3|nr:hypothetical protein [candidate division WOR-3 bacterium]